MPFGNPAAHTPRTQRQLGQKNRETPVSQSCKRSTPETSDLQYGQRGPTLAVSDFIGAPVEKVNFDGAELSVAHFTDPTLSISSFRQGGRATFSDHCKTIELPFLAEILASVFLDSLSRFLALQRQIEKYYGPRIAWKKSGTISQDELAYLSLSRQTMKLAQSSVEMVIDILIGSRPSHRCRALKASILAAAMRQLSVEFEGWRILTKRSPAGNRP